MTSNSPTSSVLLLFELDKWRLDGQRNNIHHFGHHRHEISSEQKLLVLTRGWNYLYLYTQYPDPGAWRKVTIQHDLSPRSVPPTHITDSSSSQYLFQGSIIPVVVDITANHQGYFTFKLCPNNDIWQDPKQECFDRWSLRLARPELLTDAVSDLFWELGRRR